MFVSCWIAAAIAVASIVALLALVFGGSSPFPSLGLAPVFGASLVARRLLLLRLSSRSASRFLSPSVRVVVGLRAAPVGSRILRSTRSPSVSSLLVSIHVLSCLSSFLSMLPSLFCWLMLL
ncbi:hypothetical protein PF010_g4845 [Phytophthora fragariae]|uniref:Uncharacterized protein n=1 Tax=Phytophthora fragariae TaxID=53985 RepID=A0A6G0LQX3_9STRA|nr:hypothetical protein PF010_g4845 [Phytophthora fragariae]